MGCGASKSNPPVAAIYTAKVDRKALCKEVFTALDANGDGHVDMQEFLRQAKAGDDPMELTMMFHFMDDQKKSDGKITLAEFSAGMEAMKGDDAAFEKEMKAVLAALAANKYSATPKAGATDDEKDSAAADIQAAAKGYNEAYSAPPAKPAAEPTPAAYEAPANDAPAKKGYWINHVTAIKDEETFGKYVAAAMPLLAPGNKYGAKVIVLGPVGKQLSNEGNPVVFAGVVEFDSVQAATDFWTDEEYAKARALLGDDESVVVERRVCVFEGDALPELKPKQALWVNQVEEIKDMDKFMAYAGKAVPLMKAAALGPVVAQHAGLPKMVFAAAVVFDSLEEATGMYTKPEYVEARAAGTMENGEDHVVNRTICCVEVPEPEA